MDPGSLKARHRSKYAAKTKTDQRWPQCCVWQTTSPGWSPALYKKACNFNVSRYCSTSGTLYVTFRITVCHSPTVMSAHLGHNEWGRETDLIWLTAWHTKLSKISTSSTLLAVLSMALKSFWCWLAKLIPHDSNKSDTKEWLQLDWNTK